MSQQPRYKQWLGLREQDFTGDNFCVRSDGANLFLQAPYAGGVIRFIYANNVIAGQFDNAGGSNSLNIFGFSTDFGGGVHIIKICDSPAVPAGNATAGGLLYSQAGALKWRGSTGTITTLGPADPHCPVCGADFMTEHESADYGYLAVCLRCLADELGERPYILRKRRGE